MAEEQKVTIKIAQVGSDVRKVTVEYGTTVIEAMGAAHVEARTKDKTITIDNKPVNGDTPLLENVTVVITPNVVAG